ncbi:uncharacterized protein E0L32_004599 [Thyridium curvatum]|uniref:SWR1-complex protein 3 domain-containing protein n=1 Tax=Thyridium curvatum TaxID=1093900 RepID=A0A507AZB0_9PEZI|nr:uncharacterized protein E0L32_004599 [Thyridium curvatum]TPX15322.1 hypothetical protein E0L32_004599 [Thyridium curvatum]
MEKKRKLPARAAARVEQAAKKRTATPPERTSVTPAPSTTPAVDEIPAQPLPKSIQPGKPLPTVEDAQPDELSTKEFQSVQESGVLAESLHRSRHQWISEGIFEKYWSKPSKRKGVVIEEPGNPAKDTMIKLGPVVITIEPHVFEATMFAVKDPNPKPPVPQPTFRPIMQYGPPNGTMPPPPTPTPPPASGSSTPAKAAPATLARSQTPVAAPVQPQQPIPPQQQSPMTPGTAPVPTPAPVPGPATSVPASGPPPQVMPGGLAAPVPVPSPGHGHGPVPAPAPAHSPTPVGAPSYPQQPVSQPQPMQAHPHVHAPGPPHAPPPHSVPGPPPARGMASSPPGMNHSAPHAAPPHAQQPMAPGLHMPQGHQGHQGHVPAQSPSTQQHMPQKMAIPPAPAHAPPRPNGVGPSPPPGQPGAAKPAPMTHPPGTDPIIVTLAERATEDPQLRDLMKRVANGNAPKYELDKFQKIIDEITAESKRKGAVQGPSADRLLVDGRTVRYFAEEVRAILDIVFRTNPKQTSADLRPPAGSDPLVVLLVKAALDDAKVREMVRRIADNRPQFSDATDLKTVLDRLKHQVIKEQQGPRTQSPAIAPSPTTKHQVMPNGRPALAANGPTRTPPPPQQHVPQQALRSKGPPPALRTDISAVVFEFAGGSGDRYLFPKFSILDFLQTATGQQVIASFLIVRKGSTSEYGGDPALDYYQPVTIRLSATTHRHLENLARVVAPPDEVRRYMDNIMDNMTRAEYILLAMRLPRKDKDEKESSTEKEVNGAANKEAEGLQTVPHPEPMQGVLWTAKVSATSTPPLRSVKKQLLSEEEQYQNFITSVQRKEVDEV